MPGLVTAPREDPCDTSACAVSALANTRAVETTTRVEVMNVGSFPLEQADAAQSSGNRKCGCRAVQNLFRHAETARLHAESGC